MAYEFRIVQEVEFYHTDMAGIMHYSNFFRFMEAAEHAFFRSLGGCGFGRFLLRHGRSPDTRFLDRIAAFAMPVHVSYLGTGKTSRYFDCLFDVLCQVVPKRKGLFLRHSAHVIPMSLSTGGSKVRIPSRDLVIELRNPTRQFTDARANAGAAISRRCRGIGRKATISVSRRERSKRRMGVRMFAGTANAEGCSRLSDRDCYPAVDKARRKAARRVLSRSRPFAAATAASAETL